jgi:general secretion pathway protein D
MKAFRVASSAFAGCGERGGGHSRKEERLGPKAVVIYLRDSTLAVVTARRMTGGLGFRLVVGFFGPVFKGRSPDPRRTARAVVLGLIFLGSIPVLAAEPKIKIAVKWVELRARTDEQLRGLGIEPRIALADQNTTAKADLIRLQPGKGWETNALPGAMIKGPHCQVLAPPVFGKLVGEFERQENIDILSPPQVVALSGQEALIRMVASQTLVIGISANLNAPKRQQRTLIYEPMEFGASVRTMATVTQNDRIRLQVESRLRQFLGYDNPGKGAIQEWESGKAPRGLAPAPQIQERVYATTADLGSGETILLSGLQVMEATRCKQRIPVLGSIPLVGAMFRREEESTVRKDLLLLVKAEMVEE